MACGTFNLRTDFLTGADPGGSWAVTAGTYGGSPLTGDDPAVNISTDIPLGQFVTFQYSGLDCDSNTVTADVSIVNMDLGSITSASDDLCTTDTAVTIFTELSGTLGAHGAIVWSGDVGNAGFSGSGTTATFDPSASGIGTFTFTSTINPDAPGAATDLGCCDPISATYTVTVTAAFDPGTGGTFAGC